MPKPNLRGGSCRAKLKKTSGSTFELSFFGNPGHNCIVGTTKIVITAKDSSSTSYRWEGTCSAIDAPFHPSGPRNERVISFRGTCTQGTKSTTVTAAPATVADQAVLDPMGAAPIGAAPTLAAASLIMVDVTVSNSNSSSDTQDSTEIFDLMP